MLNFDEASKAAARGAVRMGIFEKTSVQVMHAFDAPGLGLMKRSALDSLCLDDYVARMRFEATERLELFTRELGHPPTPRTMMLRQGSPAFSIIECSQGDASNLIVLGTSGKGGLERLLVGSVAEQVVGDAKHNILIIPTDA